MELLTVGHGTLSADDLGDVLAAAGVRRLVDVRTAPGSRRHPHVARRSLEEWLPARGVAYRWEPALGGWRRARPDSPNVALRHPAFRGYADYMETPAFWVALDGLVADASAERTAAMCSESVWWKCHRRLLADAAVLARGVTVLHLGHDGRLAPHAVTTGARLTESGLVAYDGGAARLGT